MTRPTRTVVATALAAIVAAGGLAACGSSSQTSSSASTSTATATSSTSPSTMGSSAMSPSTMSPSTMGSSTMGSSTMGSSTMAGMDADGGPAPAGIRVATHPKYPVGSHVVLTADHEMGMKGARATVVRAYATTTYAVDYTPTTGGAMVKDHKWVVQQEIRDAGTRTLANGTHVVLTASHMPGMQGAQAVIVQSTHQTVYMVDWDMGGMMMRHHKWVVESEMRPAN